MRLSRLVLLSSLILSPLAAKASTLLFTFTGAETGSFTLTSTTPSLSPSTYTEFNVPFGGGLVDFYTTGAGGGFSDPNDSTGNNLGFSGVQVFTGTTALPVFMTGSYTFDQEFASGAPITGNEHLTISAVSSTPEPSSLMLLGTGALGLAGAVRRRFSK